MTIPENPFALSHSSGRNANTQKGEIMETNRDPKTGDFMGGKEALEEQQKHEEIKQKAWKLYVRLMFGVAPPDIAALPQSLKQEAFFKTAWDEAEDFYKFAKEKEGAKDA